MANWFHKFFNPHCPHCIDLEREKHHCDSCEILRQLVATLRLDNERLVGRLINPPQSIENRVIEPARITMPKIVPWAVKKQMLEREDREKARLMKEAPKPKSIEELESSIGLNNGEQESNSKS